MRGATGWRAALADGDGISIHAPHAGRDLLKKPLTDWTEAISIHAPHAGRDDDPQSHRKEHKYFNPRAPCGARQSRYSAYMATRHNFNPRAPCGARLLLLRRQTKINKFQSTRPMRGATKQLKQ